MKKLIQALSDCPFTNLGYDGKTFSIVTFVGSDLTPDNIVKELGDSRTVFAIDDLHYPEVPHLEAVQFSKIEFKANPNARWRNTYMDAILDQFSK